MTMLEALRDSKLGQNAETLILDENSLLSALPKKEAGDEFSVILSFIKYTEEMGFVVVEAISVNKNSLRIKFTEDFKKAGIIIIEDVGGVTIFDFKKSKKRVLDNLFSKTYISRKEAFEDNKIEYNFESDEQQKDSYGKYIVGVMDLSVPLAGASVDLAEGTLPIALYTRYYYGENAFPIQVYRNVEDLYKGKNHEESIGLKSAQYFASADESENPLLALKKKYERATKELAESHKVYARLLEQAVKEEKVGSISTFSYDSDIAKYEAKVKALRK